MFWLICVLKLVIHVQLECEIEDVKELIYDGDRKPGLFSVKSQVRGN